MKRYYASGKPYIPTEHPSIVVAHEVRVSPRYGDGIGAGAYHRTDRNGFSYALAKDTLRGTRKGKAKRPSVRVWRNPDTRKVELRIAGTIRMGDVD